MDEDNKEIQDRLSLLEKLKKIVLRDRNLTSLLIINFIIIIPGVFWGFGKSSPTNQSAYYGDEGIVHVIVDNILLGFGNPNFSNWPSMYFYFSFSLLALPKITLYIFIDWVTVDFFVLRMGSVILSVWSTSYVYRMARDVPFFHMNESLRKKCALVAGFTYCFFFLNAYLSPLMVTEALLGFFSVVCLYYLQRAINSGNTRMFFKTCVFLSLATATKYNGILLVIPVGLALFMYKDRFKIRFRTFFFKSLFYSALPFLIVNVFFFINWQASVHYLIQNLKLVFSGGKNNPNPDQVFGLGPPETNNLMKVSGILQDFGIILSILLVISIIFLITRLRNSGKAQRKFILLILLYISSNFILLFLFEGSKTRYYFQSFSWSALSISLCCMHLESSIASRMKSNKPKKTWNVILITCLALSGTYAASANYTRLKDTRTLSRDWIFTNLNASAYFGLDGYTDLPFGYRCHTIVNSLSPGNLSNFTFDYLVISGRQYRRWTQIDPENYPKQAAFYEMLFNGSSNYTLLKVFETIHPDPFNVENNAYLSFGLRYLFRLLFDRNAYWGDYIYIFEKND